MAHRFVGRHVVVVGGNSGIGLAAARAFCNEGAATVLISGRDPHTLQRAVSELGSSARGHQADISDISQIQGLFGIARDLCTKIDILFVSAGQCSLRPIELVTEEEWHWVHDTNLKGVFFTIQSALPLMASSSSIVLTGSIAGALADPEAPVYAASKAGVRSLGRSLAAALLPRGIRVNVVSPGPTNTPIYGRARRQCEDTVDDIRRRETAAVPMKRIGSPDEVAHAVCFLASEAASFITGIELFVDGGSASL